MSNKSQRQLVYEKLLPYAKENLKKIKVSSGDYVGNKMCHHNARQRLENGDCDLLAVTLSFVPKSGVNLHMINNCGGKYIDHTLGYLSQFNTYYLIKEYPLKELKKMDTHKSGMLDLLNNYKDEILLKVFTMEEIKDLGITREHI